MQDSKSAFNKQKTIQTVGFFTLLAVILAVLNLVFDPLRRDMLEYVSERDNYYLSLLQEPEDTVDILAMGDSLSYGMIDTIDFWEQEGYTSHIVGQAGQVVPETYYELKKLMKTQSPKLVIIETHIMIYEPITELYETEKQFLYSTIPVTKYHELWKVMLGKKDSVMRPHFKGFEMRGNVYPYSGEEYMQDTGETRRIGGLSRFYMKKLKKLCDENGAELLLVSLPSPSNYSYATHKGFAELAEELQVSYIDMNLMIGELDIDWTKDMLDGPDHLNYGGTKKVSAYLRAYIKEHYDIESRTDDERVRDWNEQAEKYKKCAGIP